MNSSGQHEKFIRRCFDLAILGGKDTRPNPVVGAVLVYKDIIIGEGYHQRFGGPHAEVNCLNSVAKKNMNLIDKSTLYVSLEPCNYKGKTPACTNLIDRYHIPNLVVSSTDPNPAVDGKGLAYLKKKGVKISHGILKEEGDALIKYFKVNQLEKRPYIILKTVKSTDNYIGKKGEKIWLSNEHSTVLSHKWRSEADGILIGTNTALTDDPGLDNRLYFGESPSRIILDRRNCISPQAKVKNDRIKTFIVNGEVEKTFGKNGLYLQMDFDSPSFIGDLLTLLFDKGIFVLLVEGGAKLIHSFLSAGLWDEARVITTKSRLEAGIPAPNIVGKLVRRENISGDQLQVISRT